MAVERNQLDVVRLLLAYGADVQQVSNSGWTLLHAATNNAHVELAHSLLSEGARVDVRAEKTGTPLHMAAFFGNHEIVRLLLSHGANPDIHEPGVGTATSLAVTRGHMPIAVMLSQSAGLIAKPPLIFLPDNTASRYLATTRTGVSLDTIENGLQSKIKVSVNVNLTAVLRNGYLVARLIGPGVDPADNAVETTVTQPDEVTLEFPLAAIKCHPLPGGSRNI